MPMSNVNVSVMGAFDLGTTVTPNTSLISPLREDDPDMMFYDDKDDLHDFVLSPFTVHPTNDDDEAPMTKG